MSRLPWIWVIDDDPELRKLLSEYLDKQGFDVRTFADARDLERRLARSRPDLLVLDLMLPGDDGLAVCRRLRGAGDDIPIIMLDGQERSDRPRRRSLNSVPTTTSANPSCRAN